jgi:hypothetical protein
LIHDQHFNDDDSMTMIMMMMVVVVMMDDDDSDADDEDDDYNDCDGMILSGQQNTIMLNTVCVVGPL